MMETAVSTFKPKMAEGFHGKQPAETGKNRENLSAARRGRLDGELLDASVTSTDASKWRRELGAANRPEERLRPNGRIPRLVGEVKAEYKRSFGPDRLRVLTEEFTMENCPPQEQLELLTQKKLGPDDRAAVETHVGGCSVCQQTLASLNPLGQTMEFQTPAEPEEDAADKVQLPEELRHHPRYRVTGVLGRGGMGTVYKAEHKLLDRPVVLKVIRKELLDNAGVVQRFQREAKLAARLSHPNIVAVYEAGQLHYWWIGSGKTQGMVR